MSDQTSEIDLSPLDQIRQTEAEMTGKIAAARQNAEQILKDARLQAEALKQDARKAGHLEGQARYRALISKTEEEARTLISEAKMQAKKLRLMGQERMRAGVLMAKKIIISQTEDEQ